MRRDLRQAIPIPCWPTNSRQINYSAEIAPQLHELLVLGYQEGGGSVAAYEAWRQTLDTGLDPDPALWVIAADDHGLIGAVHCWSNAFVRDLVVHPRARRQGLASALLRQAFYQFHLRGEASVDLKVLETNQAARRLYETSGMEYVQRIALD